MRQQLEISQLAHQLRDDRFNKHDFIADTTALNFSNTVNGIKLAAEGMSHFDINNHCHGQIASRLNITKKDYDRFLTKHPDILADVVTKLFARESERRLVRTLNGTARGFLSDKFRIDMDNFDVAEAALPILQEVPEMRIESCGVTDTRMYIKGVFPRLKADVKVGDTVTAGIVISNSEVGAGSLRIEALIWRLWCLNGAIVGELLRKFHVGSKHGMDDATLSVLSQATRDKQAEAMRAVIRDVTVAATDEVKFLERVKTMQDATKDAIKGDPVKAIEVLGNSLNLTKDEESGVLRNLIKEGDLSRWGLSNALTRTSQDIEDYDRATEFERLGGRLINLKQAEWQEVAEAA